MSDEKKPISYWTAIEENKRRSLMLIISLFLLYVFFVGILAYIIDPNFVVSAVIILTIIYSILAYRSYRFGYLSVLDEVGAKPIEGYKNEYKKKLVLDVVKEVWDASGLGLKYPVPRVYYMVSDDINAFASGPGPEKAVICLTTGAIEKLERFELEGVIAHEISHIGNLDIRTMTLVSTLGSLILTLAAIGKESWRLLQVDSDSRDRGRIVLAIIFIVILCFIVEILARILVSIVSKEREFLADATAAKILNTPRGLISVFEKIKQEQKRIAEACYDDESVYIKEPPAKVRGMFFHCELFEDVFDTHPPLEERIKRLKAMF